jgi:hypothetical protein
MATQLVTRAGAGLRPARSAAAAIASEGCTAHHAGDSPWRGADRSSAARFAATTDHNRCASLWRGFQAWHMDGRGWQDIAYNWGACPHGVRYEGRGRGRRSAANGTNSGNARSEAICYIAGAGDPLTDPAKHAFLDAAAASEGGRMRWDHSDWKSTECAGDPIRGWEAQGWPRPGGATPGSLPGPVLPPPVRPTIRRGSTGPVVREFQQGINVVGGAGLRPDGIFGRDTEGAARRFQEFFGLGVDGVVGPKTWGMLLYCLALRR